MLGLKVQSSDLYTLARQLLTNNRSQISSIIDSSLTNKHEYLTNLPNRIGGGQDEETAGTILVQQDGSLLPFPHLGSYELVEGPNIVARYTFLCSTKAMLYQPKFFMKLPQENHSLCITINFTFCCFHSLPRAIVAVTFSRPQDSF